MPFIKLTNLDDSPLTLNTDQVVYAEPNGSRAKINLVGGGHIRVQQSYEDVDALLPKETVLTSLEMTSEPLTVLPVLDQQPAPKTPEQIAEEEAARKAAEQAELERQAEEARKNKGNPAKTRETT